MTQFIEVSEARHLVDELKESYKNSDNEYLATLADRRLIDSDRVVLYSKKRFNRLKTGIHTIDNLDVLVYWLVENVKSDRVRWIP
ncbi:hypothetical protein RND61_15400 [Streptomyces sp. TRM76323]|uniref:Uncharacterized protein n=1 Tax=Streptomyces tamarix TaxID=3078565 RepID=A0ABU3QLW9_9ACTN|nr:hypothetical protein [Streptomyces tamarix]MDT9683434.1 hypothetical protein [Streptomyces tamarix]